MATRFKTPDDLPPATRRAGVHPNHYTPPGPLGNTQGKIVPQTQSNPGGQSAPPIRPTEKEKSWWQRWGSELVHTGLDVIGLIPGVGELADGANALLYLAEGDKVNAAISAAAMVPGAGMAATTAKVGKKLAGAAAEGAAKKAGRETAEELAEKAKKEAAEKTEKELAEKKTKSNNGGYDKRKRGPCDHLRQGNGTGPYRGGAHSKTSKPLNDGKDSHHMPADDVSPLKRNDGPAIQMEPSDHRLTKSNGSQPGAARYRANIEALIKDGRWRDAMAMEIKDIRRIQDMIKEPRKYNEAMQEMMEYFRCLEKHKLLP